MERALHDALHHNVTEESDDDDEELSAATDHIMPQNIHVWLFAASGLLIIIWLALGLADWCALNPTFCFFQLL